MKESMRGFFVTGTDTEIGKTVIAAGVVHALAAKGRRVTAMKPVASGAEQTDAGLRNEDALHLIAAANVEARYPEVNPYCFEPPIAPHLAAEEAGIRIRPEVILDAAVALAAHADALVVEGVGGWQVPLAPGFGIPDLARKLDLPVLLVVGLRLGCINQARLSAESILASGCNLFGWVGNVASAEPMAREEANVGTLKELLPVPCLGIVPHLAATRPEAVAQHLDTGALAAAVYGKH